MAERLIDKRYRPLERRAIGGMATLWRARDERTGEVVAIKRLHPYLVTDPDARRRLVREAAALQAVDHPAIVRPRDVIDDPNDPALVMDYAAGRSLAERLAEDGPLDPEEAAAIAGTIADALSVAHDAGIVHRDVKPANILVEDSGAVHLVDFGIASVDADGDPTLTAPRTVIGTLRYTAPERLAGEAASPRSDVWALGAVLYEMLTGRPAVPGDDPATVLSAVREAPPDAAALPSWLAAIVGRAMSADPTERYPTAAAFRDALFAVEPGVAAPGASMVDLEAPTQVVPLAPPVTGPRPSLGGGWSPVDRAAAVFFGGVALVALALAVGLGINGAGGRATPATSDVPALVSVEPAAIDTPVSPSPQVTDANGNGKGRGRDHGKGKDGGGDD